MKQVLKDIKSKKGLTASARIVERQISDTPDPLAIFRTLLKKSILTKRTTEAKLKALVDAALVSEFGKEIVHAQYYPHMQRFIVNALLKEAGIKKQALSIVKKYGTKTK